MLPNSIQKKHIAEEVMELISTKIHAPKFEDNPICHICKKKAEFAVLRKDDRRILPMCSNDVNVNRQNVRYCENISTYEKRLKVGYFKDWKVVDAKDTKNPRIGN